MFATENSPELSRHPDPTPAPYQEGIPLFTIYDERTGTYSCSQNGQPVKDPAPDLIERAHASGPVDGEFRVIDGDFMFTPPPDSSTAIRGVVVDPDDALREVPAILTSPSRLRENYFHAGSGGLLQESINSQQEHFLDQLRVDRLMDSGGNPRVASVLGLDTPERLAQASDSHNRFQQGLAEALGGGGPTAGPDVPSVTILPPSSLSGQAEPASLPAAVRPQQQESNHGLPEGWQIIPDGEAFRVLNKDGKVQNDLRVYNPRPEKYVVVGDDGRRVLFGKTGPFPDGSAATQGPELHGSPGTQHSQTAYRVACPLPAEDIRPDQRVSSGPQNSERQSVRERLKEEEETRRASAENPPGARPQNAERAEPKQEARQSEWAKRPLTDEELLQARLEYFKQRYRQPDGSVRNKYGAPITDEQIVDFLHFLGEMNTSGEYREYVKTGVPGTDQADYLIDAFNRMSRLNSVTQELSFNQIADMIFHIATKTVQPSGCKPPKYSDFNDIPTSPQQIAQWKKEDEELYNLDQDGKQYYYFSL